MVHAYLETYSLQYVQIETQSFAASKATWIPWDLLEQVYLGRPFCSDAESTTLAELSIAVWSFPKMRGYPNSLMVENLTKKKSIFFWGGQKWPQRTPK